MRVRAKLPTATTAAATGTTPARRAAFGAACLCLLALAAFAGSGAPAAGAEEACPNEARRAEQHATPLPDCRAYEMASPADKNGGDVLPITNRTRVAADGSAVGFSSLTSFGDAHGATAASEYLAERTGQPGTSGWSTHGITPKQNPFTLWGSFFAATDPSYDGEMSADLSRGVFRSYRPLTDAPDVAGVPNLYVRDDLRSPGEGSYRLITDPGFPVPTPPTPLHRPFLAGASADFSHVIFESGLQLAGELPPCSQPFEPSPPEPCPSQLYESDEGTLRLAGRVPPAGQDECDDATEAPACEPAPSSQAGQGAESEGNWHSTPHMISADGSRVFFQVPGAAGGVFARIDGTRTIRLNASELESPEAPQGAELWDASVDGSRVFFSTFESLVAEDEGAGDYYMYDFDRPAGERLTLISKDGNPSDNSGIVGVVGASADGHYLYFILDGQIVAGEPTLNQERGLYVWHDGVVKYIGYILKGGDADLDRLSAPWSTNSIALMARVAADGSHLLFMTRYDDGFKGRWGFGGFDGSAPTDTCSQGKCRELYVFDAETDRLRCASCDPPGTDPTGDAQDNVKPDTSAGITASTSHITHALSDDGRYAFFSSPDALVPADTNGKYDAYEYDTVSEEVHLLSSGTSPYDSYVMDASASGRDAFFVTRQPLVGWDRDGNYDLYDARVNGGMPEPPPAPVPCEGEGCRGPAAEAPPDPAAGSAGLAGPGNPPVRRCGKGRHRVERHGKARCVKNKHRRTAGNHRRAGR